MPDYKIFVEASRLERAMAKVNPVWQIDKWIGGHRGPLIVKLGKVTAKNPRQAVKKGIKRLDWRNTMLYSNKLRVIARNLKNEKEFMYKINVSNNRIIEKMEIPWR